MLNAYIEKNNNTTKERKKNFLKTMFFGVI